LNRTARLLSTRWFLLPLIGAAVACSDSTIVAPEAPAASVSRPARVTIAPKAASLTVGDTVRASTTVTNTSGSSMAQVPYFRSTSMGVVTVTSAGVVVARGAGSALVIAELGTLADTMRVTVAPAPTAVPAGPMNGLVQVRFVGPTPAPHVVTAFTAAAARINTVINGTSGAFPAPISIGAGACDVDQPALNETVAGLLIVASIRTIDGPGATLGLAGPCLVRSGTRGIPALGIMAFDVADMDLMASRGLLNGVILHEMMHVLGIGTLWGPDRQGHVADPDGADPLFVGPQASFAYGVFGALNASLGVPVENTGGTGTRGGHWRETVFQDELMTGWAGGAMQMSAVTLNALVDMGFDVDVSKADSYSLPSLIGSGGITATGQGGVLLGEAVMEPIGSVDRWGKFIP
jgi:hypothetical protein